MNYTKELLIQNLSNRDCRCGICCLLPDRRRGLGLSCALDEGDMWLVAAPAIIDETLVKFTPLNSIG